MELPAISDGVRLILWILVGLATAVSVFVGNAFEENINYFFHRLAKKRTKGKAPEPIPWYIKALSGALFLVVIVGTAFASAAPDETLEFIAQSLPTLSAPQGTADAASQTATSPETTPTSALAEALVQTTPSEVEGAELEDPRAALAALDVLSALDFSDTEGSPPFQVLAGFSAPKANGDVFIASSLQDGSLGLFSLSEDYDFVPVGSQVVPENPGDPSALLFMSDGFHLLRSTTDGELSVWAFGPQGISPTPRQVAVQETAINAIALAPDGETVAVGLAHLASAAQADDSAISLIDPNNDLNDKKLVLNSNQTAINDLSFSQNGSLLIAGRIPYVRWFNLTPAGSMVSGGELRIPDTEVSIIFASPNNADLFFASGSSPKLHLASISQRNVLYSSAPLSGKVTALAHHPALDILAVATAECHVYLLDANTLALIAPPADLCSGSDRGPAAIGSLSFSPDGHMVLAGNVNALYLLNTYTRQPEPEPEPEDDATAQIDLGTMALMDRVSDWLWADNSPLQGNVPPELAALSSFASVSGSQGNIIGAGFPDGSLALLTIDSGSGLALIGSLIQGESSEPVSDLLFISAGELLVTADTAGELAVWTVSDNGLLPSPLRKVQLANAINSIAVSPDGQTLASGQAHLFGAAEKDDSVAAFNQPLTSDFRPQYTLINTNTTSIADLAYTADGRLLVIGETPSIQIYGLNPSGTTMVFQDGVRTQSDELLAILASPLNSNLVYTEVASERAGSIDLASGQVLQSSELLGGAVTALALHPNGRFIAVGMSNCVVHILDSEDFSKIKSSASLCEADGDGTVIGSVAFTSDGDFLVVANSQGIILLNTAAELLP